MRETCFAWPLQESIHVGQRYLGSGGKGRLGECLVEMTADLTSVGGRLEEIITVAAVRIGLGGRSSSVRLAAA